MSNAERCKRYYQKNKEKISEYKKQWYLKNRERILEKTNNEEFRQCRKEYFHQWYLKRKGENNGTK